MRDEYLRGGQVLERDSGQTERGMSTGGPVRGTTSREGRWAHGERDEYWKGTVGVRREKQVRSFEIHSRAGERER